MYLNTTKINTNTLMYLTQVCSVHNWLTFHVFTIMCVCVCVFVQTSYTVPKAPAPSSLPNSSSSSGVTIRRAALGGTLGGCRVWKYLYGS